MKQIKFTKEDAEIKDSIQNIYSAFVTGGYDLAGNTVTIQDALNDADSHLVFKRVITEIIQETIEPTLIGHMLLETIYTNEQGASQIVIRTLGPVGEIDFDIPEGGEYPEIKPGRNQQSIVTAQYSKSGCKLKITEELLASSQWNIIEILIRDAAKALARWKERKIFNMLSSVGNVVFDNVNPNASELGRTQGRDILGAGNGSMTQANLIDMYSSLLTKGYVPNVILVHPLQWAMFAKDPIIREAGMIKGDISQWLTSQISPVNPYARIRPWTTATRLGNQDRQDLSLEETSLLSRSTPRIPSYSPLSGLTIIPSHYVPFDPINNTADLIMMDTTRSGAVIVNETLMLDQWEEKERDISVIKMREKYALALYDQGRAVAVAKNISLEANEVQLNPIQVLDAGKIAPIPPKD